MRLTTKIRAGWKKSQQGRGGANLRRGVRTPDLEGTLVEEDNAGKKGSGSEAGNSKRK